LLSIKYIYCIFITFPPRADEGSTGKNVSVEMLDEKQKTIDESFQRESFQFSIQIRCYFWTSLLRRQL